jgi:hypothetical protein
MENRKRKKKEYSKRKRKIASTKNLPLNLCRTHTDYSIHLGIRYLRGSALVDSDGKG